MLVLVAKLNAALSAIRNGVGNVAVNVAVNKPVAEVAEIPPTAIMVVALLKSSVGPTVVEVFLQVIDVT